MTPEQFVSLQALQNRLLDVALEEANPDLWPGAGKKPDALTKQERGDRVWAKKNANATLSIVNRLMTLTHPNRNSAPADTAEDEAQLGEMIEKAEGEAERLLCKLNKFDRKTMGPRRRSPIS